MRKDLDLRVKIDNYTGINAIIIVCHHVLATGYLYVQNAHPT